jgi:hypothetical protein
VPGWNQGGAADLCQRRTHHGEEGIAEAHRLAKER